MVADGFGLADKKSSHFYLNHTFISSYHDYTESSGSLEIEIHTDSGPLCDTVSPHEGKFYCEFPISCAVGDRRCYSIQ